VLVAPDAHVDEVCGLRLKRHLQIRHAWHADDWASRDEPNVDQGHPGEAALREEPARLSSTSIQHRS
jgi:hypothetical protein